MNKVFKNHPHLKQYHETSDGVKFHTEDTARAHAKSLKDKKVKKVERSDEVLNKTEAPNPQASKEQLNPMQAAKLRVEAVEKMGTVAEIEKALEGETAKSVLKAGAERIASLNASKALDESEKNEETANVENK